MAANTKSRKGNTKSGSKASPATKKAKTGPSSAKSKKAAGEKKEKTSIFRRRMSKTERYVWGIVMLFVALYLLVAIVSYYFTWDVDQTVVRQGLKLSEGWEIHNSAGKLGAVIADRMVGGWFGVFALCIPVVLIILGLRVMRIKPVFLDKSVRIACITMILGSVSCGYLFGTRGGTFGSGPGGEGGIAVSGWLQGFLGGFGLGVILLMCWFLLAVYVFRDRISIFDKWRASLMASRIARHEEKERKKAEKLAERQAARIKREEERIAREYEEKEKEAAAGKLSEEEDIDIIRSGDEEFEEAVPGREGEGITIVGSGTEETGEIPEEGAGPVNGGAFSDDDDFEVIDIRGDRVKASSLREGEKPARASLVIEERVEEDENIIIVGPGGEQGEKAEPEKGKEAAEGDTVGIGGVMVASGDDDMEIIVREKSDEEAEEEELRFRDPTRLLPKYQKPSWQILADHKVGVQISREEIQENKNVIRAKLEDFGIRITDTIKATVGPTVTLYEIEPAQGVKISKIRNLEEDIALALKVQSIRIVTLGQGRGTVGIEVPNSQREIVSMLSVIKSVKFQDCNYRLPIALGRTIYNEIYIGDLTKMPHLLVAGATGQGKSVGLNAIITSLLYKKHPAELKFVLVDPKQVELSLYAKLEHHFLAKMETEDSSIITDTQKAVNTLNSLVQVMEDRYTMLNKAGERNIADYNDKLQRGGLKKRDGHKYMPYIVVIIDEFADMIMTAGREAEMPITRLAAKARAVGIHLIVATQRPDVKVITGLIKSNIPARIAFKVVSMVDSRTIIDQPGANNLIGMGDMLMYLNGELTRIQCAFIDTPEIDNVTSFISKQQGFAEAYALPHYSPPDPRGDRGAVDREEAGKFDPMFAEIARFVVSKEQGSTSAIQRNFELGYNRAGRITDQLERVGIVGPANGSRPREVLVRDLASLEIILIDLGL